MLLLFSVMRRLNAANFIWGICILGSCMDGMWTSASHSGVLRRCKARRSLFRCTESSVASSLLMPSWSMITLALNHRPPPFIRWFVHWFIHWFIHPLTHSLTHQPIHPFIHPSIHSFIHSCIHSCMHSFIQSFIHSVTVSFIYSLSQSFPCPSIQTTIHSLNAC